MENRNLINSNNQTNYPSLVSLNLHLYSYVYSKKKKRERVDSVKRYCQFETGC